MRRYRFFWIPILATLVAATGCARLYSSVSPVRGSGVKASQTRQVEAFQKIRLRGSAHLSLRIADQTRVEVQGDDNLLDLIVTKVHGDTLVISARDAYSTRLGLRVVVTSPALEAVALAGSGDIDFEGVDAQDFDVTVQGSGDVTGSGKARKLDILIQGSGDVELFGLEAAAVKVSIMGSGDAEICVEQTLDVSIKGSGDVIIHGDPRELNRSIYGSGEIIRR